jgi:hypothetical protein
VDTNRDALMVLQAHNNLRGEKFCATLLQAEPCLALCMLLSEKVHRLLPVHSVLSSVFLPCVFLSSHIICLPFELHCSALIRYSRPGHGDDNSSGCSRDLERTSCRLELVVLNFVGSAILYPCLGFVSRRFTHFRRVFQVCVLFLV